MDEKNKAPIYIYDDKGKPLEVEQFSVIPLRNSGLYCVLQPLDKIPGVADNKAIVFKAEENDGENILSIGLDEVKAIIVSKQYYKLLEKHRLKIDFEEKN